MRYDQLINHRDKYKWNLTCQQIHHLLHVFDLVKGGESSHHIRSKLLDISEDAEYVLPVIKRFDAVRKNGGLLEPHEMFLDLLSEMPDWHEYIELAGGGDRRAYVMNAGDPYIKSLCLFISPRGNYTLDVRDWGGMIESGRWWDANED